MLSPWKNTNQNNGNREVKVKEISKKFICKCYFTKKNLLEAQNSSLESSNTSKNTTIAKHTVRHISLILVFIPFNDSLMFLPDHTSSYLIFSMSIPIQIKIKSLFTTPCGNNKYERKTNLIWEMSFSLLHVGNFFVSKNV